MENIVEESVIDVAHTICGGNYDYTTMAKYIFWFLFGFILKLYDDLDDLYLFKHERIMACLRTLLVIWTCYWIFVLSESKYDLMLSMLMISFFLFDWEAYTLDPFFFSSSMIFPVIILGLFVIRGYSIYPFEELMTYIVFFTFLCTPLCEFFLIKFNGGIFEWMKPFIHFGHFSEEGWWSFLEKTNAELEVSMYKIGCRILGFIYAFTCIYVIQYYLMRYATHDTTKSMFQSLIYINMMWIGYYVLSISNQFNVLYFRPDILAQHHILRSFRSDSDTTFIPKNLLSKGNDAHHE